jgi:transcriptional antiterminator RfaH
MTNANSHWHVVQTHSRAEEKAAVHLMRQGYDVYLPRYLTQRRHARHSETVPAPLFPRHLFVSFDCKAQRWRLIQSTIGVRQLVYNGEDPASVSEGIIAELRGREDERGFVRLERRSRFAPDDPIRVVEGIFDACLGLFDDMVDHERVAILLDLLGRKVRVVLCGDAVAAA